MLGKPNDCLMKLCPTLLSRHPGTFESMEGDTPIKYWNFCMVNAFINWTKWQVILIVTLFLVAFLNAFWSEKKKVV